MANAGCRLPGLSYRRVDRANTTVEIIHRGKDKLLTAPQCRWLKGH